MQRQKSLLIAALIFLAVIYSIAILHLKKTSELQSQSKEKNKPKEEQLFEDLAYPRPEQQSGPVNKEKLQIRVRKLLQKDNVSLREDVNDIFLLGDIYAGEGKDKEAITFYQKALKVDVWRLEYQLKLARLLEKQGHTDQAVEKAKIIYQYAEDENLIKDAQDFLSKLGADVAEHKSTSKHQYTKYVEIVIVPIGKVSDMLLYELKETLQKNMGIKYSVSGEILDIGKVDRNQAEKYLTEIFNRIKSNLPVKLRRELLREIKMSEEDLETYHGKVLYVRTYFDKAKVPQTEIHKFFKTLNEHENKGQYDAERLLSNLEKTFKVKRGSNIKGYLGITEEDIFTKDFNFLFGWAHKGYGVMSYHRFRAEFNDEPPNRARLLKRAAKQGISSSFFILGIPRCTTPTCARAYPHNLSEHDQKSFEICASCKQKLNAFIKNSE